MMQSRFQLRPLQPRNWHRDPQGWRLLFQYTSTFCGHVPRVEAPLVAIRQLSAALVFFFRGGARRRWWAASRAMSARSSAESSGSGNRTSVLSRARMHRRKKANENCPRVIRLLIDFAGWGRPDASSKCVSRLMVMRCEVRYACSTAAASLSQWPSEPGVFCFIDASVIRECIFLNYWPRSSGQDLAICAVA
jgi:hypothetical protein